MTKPMGVVVQGLTKGRFGGFYLIADVGRLEGLKELGVHSKRIPAFVLPDRCMHNRGLDPTVETCSEERQTAGAR